MSIFRNLNADFETLTQTLTSRSRSQGSKILCVWKGLVNIHMHTKYEGYIPRDMEVMSIFLNLNAKCDGISEGQTDGRTVRSLYATLLGA